MKYFDVYHGKRRLSWKFNRRTTMAFLQRKPSSFNPFFGTTWKNAHHAKLPQHPSNTSFEYSFRYKWRRNSAVGRAKKTYDEMLLKRTSTKFGLFSVAWLHMPTSRDPSGLQVHTIYSLTSISRNDLESRLPIRQSWTIFERFKLNNGSVSALISELVAAELLATIKEDMNMLTKEVMN